MNVFVLDTNIISFYLKGNEMVTDNIASALTNGDSILVAPIAYYEIKRGLMAINSQTRLREFDNFCKLFGAGQFDNSDLDMAAEIYAEQRKAGRAMEHVRNLTLLDWSISELQ
jgi:predicted nucleic acid-binding protein